MTAPLFEIEGLRAVTTDGGIEADEGQLAQVLLNLTMNAQEAMPTGGALTITIDDVVLEEAAAAAPRRPGTFVVLSVSDTGRGMDEATLARIFDPFYTTRPNQRGVGLSVARQLVADAGGTLSLDPAVADGACFELRLPRQATAR